MSVHALATYAVLHPETTADRMAQTMTDKWAAERAIPTLAMSLGVAFMLVKGTAQFYMTAERSRLH